MKKYFVEQIVWLNKKKKNGGGGGGYRFYFTMSC